MSSSPNISRRRFGAALAAAVLVAGGVVAAPLASAADGDNQFTLLDFNDFHGRISASKPSTVAFADTIEKLRKDSGADKTALISSGDNVGASLFASSFKQDQPTIDVLNALDVKTSAVGNHEFDKGIDDLQDRIEPATNWNYLGANVSVSGTQMQPYEILDVGGFKVGVVGAITEETPTLVSPGGIQGVTFSDPVEAVNKYAAELKDGNEDNGEADVVIASYHEGAGTDSSETVADNGVFADIAHKTSDEVSAIFTAHTHMTYDWEIAGPNGKPRPVMQTGSYGANIGSMTFTVDPSTKEVTGIEHALHPVPATDEGADLTDPTVAKVKNIVDNTLAEAKVEGEKPVGTVTNDITTAIGADGKDDRLSESALGNLVGDYMVDSVADRGGADIAFMNPGGLRDNLLNDPAGQENNINKAEANAVLPFANTIVTMDLSGEQIKKVLEQQWQPAGGSRAFLALGTNSGFTWTFDPTRPEGDRITSISLKGEQIDPAKSYKVVSQSFLAAGGDNFFEFGNATNKKDTGLIDSDTWMEYLGERSPVSPSFAKHAVAVKDLPSTVEARKDTSFTLSDIDITSKYAKAATSGKVTIDGKEAGTVFVTSGIDNETFPADAFPSALDGRAAVTVSIPADTAEGAHTLRVELDNGTAVDVPVTVGAGTGENPGEPEGPEITGSLAALGMLFSPVIVLLQGLGIPREDIYGSLANATGSLGE